MEKLADQISASFAKSTLDKNYSNKVKPSLILVLLYFEKELNTELVKLAIFERLVKKFEKFRSILKYNKQNKIVFSEIPIEEIDLNYHIQQVNSFNWKKKDIDHFLNEKYNEMKRMDKPLWIFYILNNLHDSRSCIILNIDHAIGDGISQVQVLLSVVDKNIKELNHEQRNNYNNEPREYFKLIKKTSSKSYLSMSLFQIIFAFITGIFFALLSPFLKGDTQNQLKIIDIKTSSTTRCTAFAENISLKKLKEIKNCLKGTTINDILSALLNICIIKYLQEINDIILFDPKYNIFSAVFPINLKTNNTNNNNNNNNENNVEINNNFTLDSFPFELQYNDVISFIYKTKHKLDLVKISPKSKIKSFLIQNVLPIFLTADKIRFITLNVNNNIIIIHVCNIIVIYCYNYLLFIIYY
jgi:hypothetical protein